MSALVERRSRVEAELTSAAGGSSLCSISRSVGPVPGVKYLEGRMVALMELERSVRRGEDLVPAISIGRSRWTTKLDGARQRGMSADWTAYYAGGADEFAEWAESVIGSR